MARPLRILYENAWYHVMNRGRHGEMIFQNDDDYQAFIDLLKDTCKMWDLRVAAYSLMGNHYHLLVQTPQANLPRCMRHINSIYTQKYNRRYNKDSQLFRGRYKSILIDADSYLLELLRYIHRNPLRAGLINHIDDYAWSSHPCYLSDRSQCMWLYKESTLNMLEPIKTRQKTAYMEYMTGQDSEEITEFFSRKKLPAIIGKSTFMDKARKKFFKDMKNKEVPEAKALAPDISMIKQAICKTFGVKPSSLLVSKRGITNEARNVAVYLVRRHAGKKLKTIAEEFNINNYSTVSSILANVKKGIWKDRDFRKRVEKIEKIIDKGQRQI